MPSSSAQSSRTAESLRLNPAIRDLFKRCEGRHLNNDEYSSYLRQVPTGKAAVAAARVIELNEQRVVEKTVKDIFAIYAFEKHHEGAAAKAPRDITTVSVYATAAMLLNDKDWFRDKLLLWLRTILQSFMFPEREATNKKVLIGAKPNSSINSFESIPQKRQAVQETYIVLKRNYQQALPAESFTAFEPFLQQAVDILSAE